MDEQIEEVETPNTGILIHFDEDRRRAQLLDQIEADVDSFSDTLSSEDWRLPFGQITLALLAFSEHTIDYLSLARKGRRVATLKNQFEFYGFLNLHGVLIPTLEAELRADIRQHFIRASSGYGGVFPPATWAALLDAIRGQRPELREEIDRLTSVSRYAGMHLKGEIANILTQEREALGISLDIFSGSNKLRERVLGQWAPPEDSVERMSDIEDTAILGPMPDDRSSFLDGIPAPYRQEESAIQHDLVNWSGISVEHTSGISVFRQGGRRLDVIYANRNRLERTLGVDLIYFNQSYGQFVLVQYKLMVEETATSGMLYRPDAQLDEELWRMDSVYSSLELKTDIRSHEEYRFSEDGFMFKLVPEKGLMPAAGELIKGMYIPRKYMHFLLSENGPKGPQGGRVITFDNAPRYLTNTQFADSVRSGWIGTRGLQSTTLFRMIREYFETGKAVLVAIETS